MWIKVHKHLFSSLIYAINEHRLVKLMVPLGVYLIRLYIYINSFLWKKMSIQRCHHNINYCVKCIVIKTLFKDKYRNALQ